ncbi:PD-(D/E)XK nuclease family protein [Natrinema sp. 1APR25-10V2]|uniref:PD-(D/E)XK nuclease family protein n=1 Tax=Natrinema sp. 1APR25-10V2 TaxID=2951081 RepID=UPI002874CA45|nr:PD-(D/E)XK nuclease family protein [Natrinema sp. 1APR25-10V2]MDS0474510.1 PD-(D/E)XK nuclease family protein [Natrinema sp. 1APR25-10V2]
MDGNRDVAEELQVLRQQWEGITDVPAAPRSTMNVVEYGLGKQRRAEVYINRLLYYLLDPEQPHQMGTDFLAAFLDGLPETCQFEEDTYDLSDVRVNQQVPVWHEPSAVRDTDASPGYLDLLLDVPNEWFILIELKFSAAETGTEFYCEASQFGDRLVSEYESGQYYLYMHQADRAEASGACFANLTWRTFVSEVLDPFLADHTPRYPQRTATQLHDLKDDIQEIAGMSDQPTNDQEKIALYLDHVDAITDVTAAFESEWNDYTTQWGQECGLHSNMTVSRPGHRRTRTTRT